ncbi:MULTISPECIES: four helix bundle protein [unclassified Shewanella]|uniref:four helix bundle protein n=1 Tax=unclassified Shewanella TaxID=196818 RepID=UPI001BC28C8D|nr:MULTISPECIES: four helix bundle protein [unclassified Shewanella]GIU17995.1 four helix bundle protein [Shewanella sp. MBTL60-112-B1]GIU40811.1 four helix bundle protein [Shewanella sp. MBTL60-112-B2]
MATFKKLEIWRRGCDLSCRIYELTKDVRDYGFRDQISRAGLSIPSNIAEGIERESVKEQIRFLFISKSSAAEVITQITIGIRIGYIEPSVGNQLIKETESITMMIAALIRKKKSLLS